MLRRSATEYPLHWAYEVNERCLEMLVHAARREDLRFALVAELRELLVATSPEMRKRTAQRTFLLVDMHFQSADWWKAVQLRPAEPINSPAWRGAFPRRTGIHLVRATLILAWSCLRSDPETACVLLGMSPAVAAIIANLKFDDIDCIAKTHFRAIRPRWDDRPAVWRKLLLAAQEPTPEPMGAFNLHALQILAGELVHPSP